MSEIDEARLLANLPKPFVFVAMPFSKDFDTIYEVGIRPACADAGAYSERVDEQNYHGSVIDRIYNQIAKADIVLADLSGERANVFYETGYAHALGKKTILLASRASDIPFNLQGFAIVVYGDDPDELRRQLKTKLDWAFSTEAGPLFDPLSALQFYYNGTALSDGSDVLIDPEFEVTPEKLRRGLAIQSSTIFQIDVKNIAKTILDAKLVQVHVEMPNELGSICENEFVVRESESKYSVIFRNLESFLPMAWHSLKLVWGNKNLFPYAGGTFGLGIKLVSPSGVRGFSCSVKIGRKASPT